MACAIEKENRIRKQLLFLALILCLLTGCAKPTVQEATPTLPAATATAESSSASMVLVPSEMQTFYRLRIEYSTTSDWSRLDLLNPEAVLSMRVMGMTGALTNSVTSVERLALNQSIEDAQAGKSVSMQVDYAVSAEAISQPLKFRLEKGALHGSTVRISVLSRGQEQLLQQIDHHIVVQSDPGTNPLDFSVDLSSITESALAQAQVQQQEREKLVWAFYYPWYRQQDWSSTWLKDHPLEAYDSSSTDVMARQVQQAQDAGIDGFISSWWGPDSQTDANLKQLLDIAETKNFKVSIYFETLAGSNGAPLDETSIQAWLTYLIRTYRDHPAFYKVDGKPLVVVWASGTVPLETWKRIFEGLHAQGLDAEYLAMSYDLNDLQVFDGLHQYGIFHYTDLKQTYLSTGKAVRNYSLLADNPTPKLWAATVQPGYDDTLQPSREGQIQERQNGDFYRSTWEAAIASNPDWIFITSWNEWWEHTHIEPGQLYGDQYLRITREYVDRWKGQ